MDNCRKFLKALVPAGDAERAWLFFVFFSRFEYALKRSGYVYASADRVAANWDRFASRYCTLFNRDSDIRLRAACDYFTSNPPKKQIRDGSALSWADSHSLGNHPLLCWLVTMLRRVRNNLVHGGKFPEPVGPITDPARDPVPLEHSLVILDALLKLDSHVRNYFIESTENFDGLSRSRLTGKTRLCSPRSRRNSEIKSRAASGNPGAPFVTVDCSGSQRAATVC